MIDTIPTPPPESCSEKEFQSWILKVAKAREWKWSHTYRALMQDGQWRTTCATGFPDLLLIRGERLVVFEVKSKSGRVDPAQDEWLDAFGGLPCCESWVVDPTMSGTVVRLLR